MQVSASAPKKSIVLRSSFVLISAVLEYDECSVQYVTVFIKKYSEAYSARYICRSNLFV